MQPYGFQKLAAAITVNTNPQAVNHQWQISQSCSESGCDSVTNHIIHSNWAIHLPPFQLTNHPSLVSRQVSTLERGKDCNKSTLREYHRELNDPVWPGGITLQQEAHFYTTPLLSPLILIYLLAKLHPFQFRSALKHTAYREEVSEQREEAD